MNHLSKKEVITRLDFSDTLDASYITSFKANLVGGNVIITGSSQSYASIKVQWNEKSLHTVPRFYIKGDALHLEATSWLEFKGQTEPFIIKVIIPAHVDVAVKMFAGVLHLEHLTGDVTARVRWGEINSNVISRHCNLTVWAGDIKAICDKLYDDTAINTTCYLGDISIRVSDKKHLKKCLKAKMWLGDIKITE